MAILLKYYLKQTSVDFTKEDPHCLSLPGLFHLTKGYSVLSLCYR